MEFSSVAEQLFFTTVKVETVDTQGNPGVGTSFVFNLRDGKTSYLFLVTNKHVLKGVQKGRLLFLRGAEGKPILGSGFNLELDNFGEWWFGHPDEEIDVAVAPLVPLQAHIEKQGVEVFYRAIPDNLVPSKESLKQLDALEEVIFIGYPSGIWDRKNLLPIARRGTTATPVAVDFQGIKQFQIDASVFPGSSGSPVFLYDAGMYHDKRGTTIVGTRLLFLGVVASVFYEWQENELRLKETPTAHVPTLISRQMIDLGIVFKADTVLEAVKAYLNSKGVKTS